MISSSSAYLSLLKPSMQCGSSTLLLFVCRLPVTAFYLLEIKVRLILDVLNGAEAKQKKQKAKWAPR